MASWNPPPLPPRVAALTPVPLVGRQRELDVLERLWAEVTQRRRQLVLVGGEPGAGKSRMIAELARALHGNDVTVLVGTSSPDAGVPYQPFVEMLDHLFAHTAGGALGEAVGRGGPELLRLSPEAARHGGDLASAAPADGDVRRRLFDAVVRLFQALAEERPLALIVDDLHWAQLPTLALLDHVVQACPQERVLVLAAFRTTAPDRSDEIAARVAELHRLEGVTRLDLSGLDTDAIAEYVTLRTGLAPSEARASAAILRDRTGGNPFFLRELWADLERRGGVAALRHHRDVPASISDTLAGRLAALDTRTHELIKLAAVLGVAFDVGTLLAASDEDAAVTLGCLDTTIAAGLIEPVDPDRGGYAFVHALTREAVLDRMPNQQRAVLHARAAGALERQPPDAAVVARLAHHYLAAHGLGLGDRALRFAVRAGKLAERSLAFEDAAAWFERAAALPECQPAVRAELLLAAAANDIRACYYLRARTIYERLVDDPDPSVRLAAAVGFEEATWRPTVLGTRAADVLSSALDRCGFGADDPRYVEALASLGRALTFAGDTSGARQIGARAVELARQLGDDRQLMHALRASLWHGTSPAMADIQLARAAEAEQMAAAARDHETLCSANNFLAIVCYLVGRPDEFEAAVANLRRSAKVTGEWYHHHVACELSQGEAFLRGDFAGAEAWAEEALKGNDIVGDELAEGPHSVEMFMIRRETGGLDRFRPYLDGRESFAGRWVPGLLALYTELGVEEGIRRALHQLMRRDLADRTDEAQWPMELVFMVEAALTIGDTDAIRALTPRLEDYAGMNIVAGTMIATFGSTERFLGRAAAALGDDRRAEACFAAAFAMDSRMRSVVHMAETLAHHARFAASRGQAGRAAELAVRARALAEPIGQQRVLRVLQPLASPAAGTGLTDRELEVLRLVVAGLSNQEIGARLHISANTAANHVRSILMKTGAANRTQAAMYAAQHRLA